MFSFVCTCCHRFTRWSLIALCAFAFGLAHAQDPTPPPLTQNMVKDAFVQALKEFASEGAGDDWRIATLPTLPEDDFEFLVRDLEFKVGANVVPYLFLLRALYPDGKLSTIYDSTKGYPGLQYFASSNFYEHSMFYITNIASNTRWSSQRLNDMFNSYLFDLQGGFQDDFQQNAAYIWHLDSIVSGWDHIGENESGADVWVQNFDELVDALYYNLRDLIGPGWAIDIADSMLGDDEHASTNAVSEMLKDYQKTVDSNYTNAEESISQFDGSAITTLVDSKEIIADLREKLDEELPDPENFVSSGTLSYTITFSDSITLLGFTIPSLQVDYAFLMEPGCPFTTYRDSIYFALFFVWFIRFLIHNLTHLASMGQSGRVS